MNITPQGSVFKSPKRTVEYSAVQIGHSFINAIAGFSSVILLDAGLTNSELGVVLTLANVLSAILQTTLARTLDKRKSSSISRYLITICLALILASTLLLVPGLPPTLIALLTLNTGVPTMIPLVSSLAMLAVNTGFNVNFGLARGLGSLNFALATAFTGWIITRNGAKMITWLIVFALVIMIIAIINFKASISGTRRSNLFDPDQSGGISEARLGEVYRKTVTSDQEEPSPGYNKRKFHFLILGWILILTGNSAMGTYLYQITTSLGGGAQNMGMARAISAIAELPPMLGFVWLSMRFSSSSLLRLSSIGFALKSVLLMSVSNIYGLYLVASLQFMGYGLFIPSSVYYVNELLPRNAQVQGQVQMNMTWMIGIILGTLSGGFIIDHFGMRTQLVASAILSICGVLLVLPSVESLKNKSSHICATKQ